jgi:hypothetical protein
MSTVRGHLQEVHTRLASHHIAKAKHHKAMATHFRKFHKAMEDDGDGMDSFENIASAHDEISGEHEDCAQFHVDCAKSLSGDGEPSAKAFGMDSSARRTASIAPDRISGVAPEAPRAVPRAGAPTIPARPEVPLEFEKLVAVDDDVIQ